MNSQNESAPKQARPMEPNLVEPSQDTFVDRLSGSRGRKYARFVMAALGGLPWIGGLIAAVASLSAENDQQKTSDLQKMWLEEHKRKAQILGSTLDDILIRLDNFGPEVQERIES